MKLIFDYFENEEEYPELILENILPYGTLWRYVSSSFLNGLVNYASHLAIFSLDRYTLPNEDIEVRVCNKGEFGKYYDLECTKLEVIEKIQKNEIQFVHTNLNSLRDDIVILSKIGDNKYMFFWFDCDVSDCSVGRFETTDSIEDVLNSVENWLKQEKKEGEMIEGVDNDVFNYHKLPLSFIGGWVSF